ncbi:hypothetical protein JTB14_017921 [Gonioctena quinquepunctata]|nr:hypothetical protein JTB14_017921 [Gonioctena quinquepunctata]
MCLKTLHQPPRTLHDVGRPPGVEMECANQSVHYSLENSNEECQFTMEELMEQIEGDFGPHPCTIRRHLLQKYEEDILVTTSKPHVVSFRATG